MPDEPDELDELLAAPHAGDTPGLRDALLRRTRRRLAFGRRARRAGKFAAVAAVFAAGVGVGLWRAPHERETVFVPTPVERVEVVAVPVIVAVPVPPPGSPAPGTQRGAKVLELDAEQADDSRAAALYRQAGDAYLGAEQDYANAARCYRLFLARGGADALSPESADSWLLTSLKNATFKEKAREKDVDG